MKFLKFTERYGGPGEPFTISVVTASWTAKRRNGGINIEYLSDYGNPAMNCGETGVRSYQVNLPFDQFINILNYSKENVIDLDAIGGDTDENNEWRGF